MSGLEHLTGICGRKNKTMKLYKQTDNRFLNMYEMDFSDRDGKAKKYFFASRAQKEENLKMNAGFYADGVDIAAFYDEKIVLVRQYRKPIDAFIYECPAGLIEPGETPEEAAVREFHEETGMTLHPVAAPEGWNRPFFTSIGMSDEACSTVFGTAHGQISDKWLEPSELLEVKLANRTEAERILREEPLSIRCALLLMQFVSSENIFGFLRL